MPLYKHPRSPYWYVRIGRKTRCSTGTANRAEAEEFERTLQERLWRLERLGDRGAVPWREVAERWLKESAKPKRRDGELLEWLAPKIGQYSVADVADPDIILKIRELGLQEGWAPPTVDRLMAAVRAVLKRALAWRCIDAVPHIPMYGQPQAEPRWLTGAEFQALCRELPPHLGLAARFAVLTGLRMRAMLGLTWDRIDLEARRAWVPASQMKAAKTLALPLSPDAVQVLLELRARNPSGPWVFQWNERPIDDCNTRAFKEAVKRAGVGPLRWHDLRHTFASWAVQGGVRLDELMQLGGWSDYRMALRYGHLAPSQVASAAERVAKMLNTAHTAERGSGREKCSENRDVGGGAAGDRTPDLRIANATLSQLSYRPVQGRRV